MLGYSEVQQNYYTKSTARTCVHRVASTSSQERMLSLQVIEQQKMTKWCVLRQVPTFARPLVCLSLLSAAMKIRNSPEQHSRP